MRCYPHWITRFKWRHPSLRRWLKDGGNTNLVLRGPIQVSKAVMLTVIGFSGLVLCCHGGASVRCGAPSSDWQLPSLDSTAAFVQTTPAYLTTRSEPSGAP